MSQSNKHEVIAASFVAAYYNTLVSNPGEVQQYYMDTAEITHFGTRNPVAAACFSLPQQLQDKLESHLCKVDIETIAVAAHGESGVRITVEGSFLSSVEGQHSDFRQVFELQEVSPACYGVSSDVLTDSIHPTTVSSSATPSKPQETAKEPEQVKERLSWADTPPMFQQKATAAPPATEALPSNTTTTAAAAASSAPTPSKPAPAAPTNFAEALRMKAQGAPATTTIVRASDKKKEEEEKEEQKDNKRGKDAGKGKRAPASQQKSKSDSGKSKAGSSDNNNAKNSNTNKNKGNNSEAKKNASKE